MNKRLSRKREKNPVPEQEVTLGATSKPIQHVYKKKREKLGNKNEIFSENVVSEKEEAVWKETINPVETVVVETATPVVSDHTSNIEESPPVPSLPVEPPVDWDTISIEVQDPVPDTKRPCHDENSECDLDNGDIQQPILRNNHEADGSSVGGDSSARDFFSRQQQLCEDPTKMEQDDNKEKGAVRSEHVETSLVNYMNTGAIKVDLTQSFVTNQVFDSRDALIEWCQEVGRKHMSVVVISKSRKPVQGRAARLELGCERGGVYRDHKKKADTSTPKDLSKKRESGTRKCGCPFTLKGVWMAGDKWKVRVHCGVHNHELPETLVGHSYVARLKEEEKQILVDLTKSGVRPRQVLSTLKERSKENMSTMRTIYNARATLKLMEIDGKSAMQQVMGLLLKHHYVEWHRKDKVTDELKDIFWAHPESLQLALGFHSVLMIDCTYKNNRFGSPLFRIVGVTSTGKLFTVAFVFMEAETEDHYAWAFTRLKRLFSPNTLPCIFLTDGEHALVNAISTVFPQAEWLLCSSHVSTNVSENCKQYFETDDEFERFMKDWTNLTQVRTKDEYTEAFCDFVLTWTSYPGCIQYLRETWLRHKERFVLAWTKSLKHFGNTAMNRGGSYHAKLKSQLGSSASTFSTCWTSMHQMICIELMDIKSSFEKSLISVPHEYMLPAFKELRGYVSHKAMELLLPEQNRSEDVGLDVGVCGCVLRLSYGLPCAHELAQYRRNGTGVPLSEIDWQWKLLSAIPVPEEHSEFDYLPQVKLVRVRWEKASQSEREIMQKKLWEIAPTTPLLLESSVGVQF